MPDDLFPEKDATKAKADAFANGLDMLLATLTRIADNSGRVVDALERIAQVEEQRIALEYGDDEEEKASSEGDDDAPGNGELDFDRLDALK